MAIPPETIAVLQQLTLPSGVQPEAQGGEDEAAKDWIPAFAGMTGAVLRGLTLVPA